MKKTIRPDNLRHHLRLLGHWSAEYFTCYIEDSGDEELQGASSDLLPGNDGRMRCQGRGVDWLTQKVRRRHNGCSKYREVAHKGVIRKTYSTQSHLDAQSNDNIHKFSEGHPSNRWPSQPRR